MLSACYLLVQRLCLWVLVSRLAALLTSCVDLDKFLCASVIILHVKELIITSFGCRED